MWLLGRLVPDHKTIADFRKDNGSKMSMRSAAFRSPKDNFGLKVGSRFQQDGAVR
jgi:hypothetical protein